MAENFVPVTEDLRLSDLKFDVVKGLELVSQMTHDKQKDPSLTAAVEAGDWLVLSNTDTLVAPGSTGVGNTYPVWVGDESFDTMASGKLTVILGGGYIVQTKKFQSGSYVAGTNLTVKIGGGGEKYVVAAGGADAILARVTKAPGADGVMEYLVLNR
jgi:hypothetical protein